MTTALVASRAAIAAAAAGDTITFSPGLVGPIKLTSGVLELSKPITIQGPGRCG